MWLWLTADTRYAHPLLLQSNLIHLIAQVHVMHFYHHPCDEMNWSEGDLVEILFSATLYICDANNISLHPSFAFCLLVDIDGNQHQQAESVDIIACYSSKGKFTIRRSIRFCPAFYMRDTS